MNYDDAFKHYKEGTASDEEKEFVKQEIAKARALASLLEDDSVSANAAEIKRADAAEIKAAKKEFSWRGLLIGLIAMIVLIAAVGIVLGCVFGAAAGYANDNITVSKEDAVNYAIAAAYADAISVQYGTAFVGENTFYLDERFNDIDRKFRIESDLQQSYYVYEIEVKGFDEAGYEWEYKIGVNTRTGNCMVLERDKDFKGVRL